MVGVGGDPSLLGGVQEGGLVAASSLCRLAAAKVPPVSWSLSICERVHEQLITLNRCEKTLGLSFWDPTRPCQCQLLSGANPLEATLDGLTNMLNKANIRGLTLII